MTCAVQNGFIVITIATAAGAGFYIGIEPFFPDFQAIENKSKDVGTSATNPTTPKGADVDDPTQKGESPVARDVDHARLRESIRI